MIAAYLAAPALGAVHTVLNTNDTGMDSLREAMTAAAPGDVIEFDTGAFPPGFVTCVLLDSALPKLNDAGVVLDGGGRACIRPRVALSNVNGLEVTADGVTVTGMTVEDFGRVGILVEGAADVSIGISGGAGNTVTGAGWDGISVSGRESQTHDDFVFSNLVSGSCGSPAAKASCGGITVRPGNGGAPAAVEITDNTVLDTQAPFSPEAQGVGILLAGGSDALVTDNDVGLAGQGNAGHGILVAAPKHQLTVGPILTGNVVVDSGRNGIVLGIRSTSALVTSNFVGVGANGTDEIPNAGVGLQVFSSGGHEIGAQGLGNVFSANERHGVEISGLVNPALPMAVTIGYNIVGLASTGDTKKANLLGGIRIAGTRFWTLAGNTVSGNEGIGIEASGADCEISDNLVGVKSAGNNARANAGEGMRLDLDNCTVAGNTVSGNEGDGIRALGSGLEFTDNHVGTGVQGEAAIPNEGVGMRLDLVGGTVAGNTVSGNTEDGILLGGSDTLLEANRVGLESELEADLGNGGDGIRLEDADHVDIQFNAVAYNGGAGIRVGGVGNANLLLAANEIAHNGLAGVDAVQAQPISLYRFTKNSVSDNGRCAYEFDPANLPVLSAPIATVWGPNGAKGTYTPVVASYTVEVVVDEGTEARRYLGDAVLDGVGAWTLDLLPGMPRIPSGARVSAIYVGEASSSPLESHCEDGCGGAGTCSDGNDCTSDVCLAGVCGHPFAAAGSACDDASWCSLSSSCNAAGACELDAGQVIPVMAPCDDGDACTTGEFCQADGTCAAPTETHDCADGALADLPGCWAYPDVSGAVPTCDPTLGCGEPVFRPPGDACHDDDHCLLGDTCDALGSCVAGSTPVTCPDTDCNTCTCDPAVGCTCFADDNDGICSVDDWHEGTAECSGDDDHDGFPNEWENAGLDGNCDGDLNDADDYAADAFQLGNGLIPIYLELDWMTSADHDHDPTGSIDEMVATYQLFGGFSLLVEYDEALDHHAVIVWGDDEHPSLLRTDDYIWYSEVKASHFAPERRGVYGYGVIAHRLRDDASGHAGGVGETPGDDFVITPGLDLDDQPGSIFHEKGHNQGLTHGGDSGPLNYEVNYQSTMNYQYSGGLNPVEDTGIAVSDYSHEVLYDLDETALNEFNPTVLGAPVLGDSTTNPDYPHYMFKWFCPDGSPAEVVPSTVWVDFDCSGTGSVLGTVAVDLDAGGRTEELMTGFDDWGLEVLGEGGMTLDFQKSDNFSPGYVAAMPHGEQPDLVRLGLLGTRHPRIAVLPGCEGPTELPPTPGRRVTAIVYGNLRLDVGLIDVTRSWVGGARPIASELRDVDHDGFVDLVLEHRSQDLTLDPDAVIAHVGAFTLDGMQVIRTIDASFASEDPDSDGDGIHDACDACPGDGSAPNGPDGCPW